MKKNKSLNKPDKPTNQKSKIIPPIKPKKSLDRNFIGIIRHGERGDIVESFDYS